MIEDDENQNTQRISSSESDEEPPPLPPPRGESLNSSKPPDRPLPSEPVNHHVSHEPDA